MRAQILAAAAVFTAAAILPGAAWCADPAAQQAPIHGSSVMGDKGHASPDGWSWAPQTRDESASGPNPGAKPGAAQTTPNTMPDPNERAAKALPAGQDPGTPARTDAAGPGSMDANASPKRP